MYENIPSQLWKQFVENLRNIRQLMSKLGCQLAHKISDSWSQNRNQNLIFDRILFFLNYFYIINTCL